MQELQSTLCKQSYFVYFRAYNHDIMVGNLRQMYDKSILYEHSVLTVKGIALGSVILETLWNHRSTVIALPWGPLVLTSIIAEQSGEFSLSVSLISK